MATPTRKTPSAKRAPAASTTASDAPASAHNIWLAGLGALAQAQADGSKAFEALVKQGLAMQAQTQTMAREQWQEATQRMGAMTAAAPSAVAGWDRLGGIFEGRVAKALASMGMPTAAEINALNQRVAALEDALARLQGPSGKTAAARKARAPR